jgi:hypothetical protein
MHGGNAQLGNIASSSASFRLSERLFLNIFIFLLSACFFNIMAVYMRIGEIDER